jgi:hypothetical protein
MTDANVSVNFSASTGDLESGITAAREALASLAAPIADINGRYLALGASLAEAHTRALQAVQSGNNAAYADSLRAAQEALEDRVKLEKESVKETLKAYSEAARNHEIIQQDELQDARESVEQSYALELDLMNRRRELSEGSLAQRQRISDQIAQLERQEQRDLEKLTLEGLASQANAYRDFGDTVTKAFNGQLNGLITGTESWRDAFRKTLTRLLIDFIEFSERMVVRWIATEAANTAASASGATSRAALAQAGAAASLATQGATMIRSILGSAAETFAGVFGFLAPLMGPLAAGPAAAAQATVAGAAGAVASADIGMWSVPADMLTLVHHNELIMPASEAGAFRDLLSGSSRGGDGGGGNVSITPTTHFHVNAIDGGSVSQWMRANSSQMLRAVDEAVRHGAHLGLRRLGNV